jgi:hypothetical protein
MLEGKSPAIPLQDYLDSLPRDGPQGKGGTESKKPRTMKLAHAGSDSEPDVVPDREDESGEDHGEEEDTGGSDEEADGEAARPGSDADMDWVWAKLSEKRMEWDEQALDVRGFYHLIRGGKDTAKRKGIVYDCVAGYARAGLPTTFCKKYGLGPQKSWSFQQHTEVIAMCLAQEWCLRMEHYFCVWLSNGEDYHFTQRDKDSYPIPHTWGDLKDHLPLLSTTALRVREIDDLFPSATGAASSSSGP